MYLIGELYRRIGNPNEALLWFSNLITTPGAPERIKEKARDQKDLILAEEKKKTSDVKESAISSDESQKSTNNKSIFSKLFNN